MPILPKWYHQDGTECVAGHVAETMQCAEGGGVVCERIGITESLDLLAKSHSELQKLVMLLANDRHATKSRMEAVEHHVEELRCRVVELEGAEGK